MLGYVIIQPREAKLRENILNSARIEPYCAITLGDCQIKGMASKKGGLYPSWTENMVFRFKRERSCIVQVKDKCMLTNDDLLGVCNVNLENLLKEKSSTKWYYLYYRKSIVGQVLVELTFVLPNQQTRYINCLNQNYSKQSKDHLSLLKRNTGKHIPEDSEDLIVLPEDNVPHVPSHSVLQAQLNMAFLEDSRQGQKHIDENPIHEDKQSQTACENPQEINENVRCSHAETTPSKSQQIQGETPENAKRPRKKSIGRQLLDSIKHFFNSKKKPKRKQSSQIDPLSQESQESHRDSIPELGTRKINTSPLRVEKLESERSSISTIKSIVFDQKNDLPIIASTKKSEVVLREIVGKENKLSDHKKKVSFSINSQVSEDKENERSLANRTAATESTPLRLNVVGQKPKYQPHSEQNIREKDQKELEDLQRWSTRIADKESIATEVSTEPNWLEMTLQGFIVIEDLNNNEKRILDIKPSRLNIERDSVQSGISRTRETNSSRKGGLNGTSNNYRRTYR